MSLADRLKHLVVEDDPTPTPPVKVTVVAAPEKTIVYRENQALSSTPVYMPEPQPVAPEVADGFLAKLNQKIALPGDRADRFEKTLASLALVPDEAMRLTATLSVLKNNGVDAQGILADYDSRLGGLQREITLFNATIAAQRKQELGERTAQLVAVEAQIQQLQSQRTSLFNAITEAKARLDRSQVGFDNAAAALKTKIDQAVARLKGGM